jgi:hypothetical protein
MRKHTRLTLIVSLLAGGACFAAAPAVAQDWHGAPHVGAPSGGRPPGRPAFHAAPIRGAAPGHVFAAPRGGVGFRGGVTVHPFAFQHRDFAHFTPAERTEWTHGWWHHGQWHGRWGWWWFAGGDWWWYDQPVYPYPTYVSDVYYDEPTYDQGGAGAYWYYCQNPPGYYPYVQHCNGPWQPVPPTPPQGGPGYDQGPQGYQGGPDDQGPPPGYQGGPGDQGPPPGYPGGPGDQGPPPGYDQGPPPPNSGQGPGYSPNQGPPPGYQQGPPPGGPGGE